MSHEWQRWSGYLTAASYELHPEWEYHAIRGAAALIDISPLRKYRVRGLEAENFLNRVVTRDVAQCAIGQVLYTPWCDDDGKVIDDGTLQRFSQDDFRLTSADHNLRWLHDNALGMDVDIHDESEEVAALALQGPTSRDLLKQIVRSETDLDRLGFFKMTRAWMGDTEITITRTGFTGDLGYEIWLSPEHAEAVWDRLMEAGQDYRLTPTGMHALGLARIEAGLILINVDYISAHHALVASQKSSPFELGLGWAVNLDKAYFNGQEALITERTVPPLWRLVGLEIDWPAIETLYQDVGLAPSVPVLARRESLPLYASRRQIGYASSSCYSPILKKYIALATVESAFRKLGTQLMIEITVEHQRKQVPATVVKLPFFDPKRKKT